MTKKVLVVVAHADDEVIGCGGTLAKFAATGHDIRLIILADGESARADGGNLIEKIRFRKEACLQASKAIGIQDVVFFDFPDNRLDALPLLDIVIEIEKYSQKFLPDVVFTHHGGDLNIDHRIAFKACMTVFRPMPGQSVKKIITFEVLSSTEWQSPYHPSAFNPNWFVNINSTYHQKVKSLEFYKDEMREFPHPRSLAALRNLAEYRGAMIGCELAEAFMLIRGVD